jgi:hypothetical protein
MVGTNQNFLILWSIKAKKLFGTNKIINLIYMLKEVKFISQKMCEDVIQLGIHEKVWDFSFANTKSNAILLYWPPHLKSAPQWQGGISPPVVGRWRGEAMTGDHHGNGKMIVRARTMGRTTFVDCYCEYQQAGNHTTLSEPPTLLM